MPTEALYTRAYYVAYSQKYSRNSEGTFGTPQDQKLPVKIKGAERDRNSEGFKGKGKNMLIFSKGNDAQNTSGLSQRRKVRGRCCFLGHTLARSCIVREMSQRREKEYE